MEQVVSSIRTVYSCFGEYSMMKSYKFALEPTLKLGIKQARIVERNGNGQHWSHICCLGSSRLVG